MENHFKVSLRRAPKSTNYTNPLTVYELGVEVRGRWISLVPWLINYGRTHQDTSHTEIEWRRSTGGQTFSFLDLPIEIRIMVYEKIIGSYVWPRKLAQRPDKVGSFHVESPKPRGTNLEHRTKSSQYWHDPIGARLPQSSAMPLVSRQVRDEFAKVLWQNTTKHFNCPADFGFGDLILDAYKFNFCRRVSLGYNNAQYLGLVGLFVQGNGLRLSNISSIRVITNIMTLKYLNLHFQVSPPDAQHADPWESRYVAEVSCQKTLVDWILTAALTQIVHVPKITLSGHVKDSTRRKWEPILEDAWRGVKHDMTIPMAGILSVPQAQL